MTVIRFFVWFGAIAAGFAIAVVASRRVVRHASSLAARSRLPKFVIGVSLLAIGTDLPEIANSIIASMSGHGDINIGDSLGSAATQVTLVLGLLPFLGGAIFIKRGGGAVPTAWLTAVALGVGALAMADGHLGRIDAAVMIGMWLVGSLILWRIVPQERQMELLPSDRPRSYDVAGTIIALVFVAGGAALAIFGIIGMAEILGIPDFLIAFFGASIGTSLPELVVTVSAIRRGEPQLAIGDALGSSFVDATLSIASGPLIFPTAITASFAIRGAVAALVAVTLVALLLGRIRRLDRRSGLILLVVYGTFFLMVP